MSAPDRENQFAGESTPSGPAGQRQEVGDAQSSQRHTPHLTANDKGAPLQDDVQAPNDVPVLPANASGHDTTPADQQQRAVNDESMYEGRPTQDKDQPPSGA